MEELTERGEVAEPSAWPVEQWSVASLFKPVEGLAEGTGADSEAPGGLVEAAVVVGLAGRQDSGTAVVRPRSWTWDCTKREADRRTGQRRCR
jgi:hypothetical protein